MHAVNGVHGPDPAHGVCHKGLAPLRALGAQWSLQLTWQLQLCTDLQDLGTHDARQNAFASSPHNRLAIGLLLNNEQVADECLQQVAIRAATDAVATPRGKQWQVSAPAGCHAELEQGNSCRSMWWWSAANATCKQ